MKTIIFAVCLLFLCAQNIYAEQSAEEMMATFLNLKGQLCAKVVNINKLQLADTYEVRCIEYRGGTGTVDYLVNIKTGEVVKR